MFSSQGSHTKIARFLCIAALLAPASAMAHHAEFMKGHPLMQGMSMPVHGLDHLMLSLAVGILASQMQGIARWLVALGFTAVLVLGGLINVGGVSVPGLELGITASLLIGGVLISRNGKISLGAALTAVSLFGLYHGGALVPAEEKGPGLLLFVSGCAAVAITLVLLGMGIGLLLKRLAGESLWPARVAGFCVFATAFLLLMQPEWNGIIITLIEK